MEELSGIPLQQAIERYADRKKWQAYSNAVAQKVKRNYRTVDVDFIFVPVSEWAGLDVPRQPTDVVVAIRNAERLVIEDFWNQLLSEDLVATGYVTPIRIDSKRQKIPPHLYRVLQARFANSSFVGPDIKIVDVLILAADEYASLMEPATSSVLLELASAAVAGCEINEGIGRVATPILRGRPGLPAAFEQEMRRRAEVGELQTSLAQEVAYLREWGDRTGLHNPAGKPWAVSTIKNKLRDPYRDLTTRKTTRKGAE